MSTSIRDDTFMAQFKCPHGIQGREVAALMNREHDALTEWGLGHVRVGAGFSVLDVGCGGGNTLSKLAQLACRGWAVGLDCSRDMVEYSRQNNQAHTVDGRMGFLRGSVEKLGFSSGTFDLVTAVETYYFWGNLTDAFGELYRVLKGGGCLLLVNEMIKDGRYEVEHAQTIKRAHVHLESPSDLTAQLQQAGFSEVEIFLKAQTPWNTLVAHKE
ncbi:MAG: class I SAM-dependent methyltransferase [Candidatus Bathyarchaeota archaeon]|nr:class I SAM-dependent methyltransferase [Candidatus Bathyarchaeota archaeon]